MRFSKQALLAILPAAHVLAQATFESSSKRGLVFTPEKSFPADDKIWIKPGSDLTWYYNYMAQPSPTFANISQSKFEFIPMMWGAAANSSDNTFSDIVQSLIFNGTDIQHILTFNEPDGPFTQGGCQMDASLAAETWQREIVPLQKMGVKAGAPAVTQRGSSWLADFYGNCTSCKPDFIPLHYYGDYKSFTAYTSSVVSLHPNVPIWVTEYAYDHQNLQTSQDFFNKSAKYLDSSTFIERYSWYGALRSDISNVGPNAALLTANGSLTDIGSWYLGGAATNNIPSGPPGSGASRSSTMSGTLGGVLLGVMAMHWIFSC